VVRIGNARRGIWKVKKNKQILILITTLFIACGVSIVCCNYLLNRLMMFKGSFEGNVKLKALIADSLMSDFPNPELIDYLINVLVSSGYDVDVVYGSDVSLTLYSRLTDYSLIILRVHGGKAIYRTPDGTIHKINGLFTGVLWSDEYYELKKEWIATRAFPYNSTKAYLAVLPRFFDVRLKGRFKPNSVVIVASCYSLFTRDKADALGRRGLSIFIGWEGLVTLEHMDEALKLLMDKVFRGNLT